MKGAQREEERVKMSQEINQLLNRKNGPQQDSDEEFLAMRDAAAAKRTRIGKLPEYEAAVDDVAKLQNENSNTFNAVEEKRDLNRKHAVNLQGLAKDNYVSGQYCGLSADLKRSPKLNVDPIIELRHIIGYSPDRCLNLKWSRFPNDPNVVIFTSGGTLIAMDIENNA
jgi:uncharacterized protein with WD repeat